MAYKIPLFNLNFDEREAQAAYDTIKSGWISTGPKNAELEQMFIDMWGVKYAVSMANCTDSLHVACMVCGFGPGDEVICPSLPPATAFAMWVPLPSLPTSWGPTTSISIQLTLSVRLRPRPRASWWCTWQVSRPRWTRSWRLPASTTSR